MSSKVLLPIVIIQFAVIAFLVFQLNKQKNEITDLVETVETKTDELEQKTTELETISADLNRVREEREKLGLDNTQLNTQITELNTYISKLKKEKKLDEGKRKELQELIAKLRNEITVKDQEIAQLKTQNDSLQTGITTLSVEKKKLGDSLSNVASNKKTLESKLAYAAVLKAQEFKITVLKSNGKEIEDDVYKASKIDRLKIEFGLADNRAAEQNQKTFYFRLRLPTGEVFSDANNGGGVLTTAEGQSLPYTMSQLLAFDNSGQKVTFITFSGFKYVAGDYGVEIYCEGYKIGTSGFKVK